MQSHHYVTCKAGPATFPVETGINEPVFAKGPVIKGSWDCLGNCSQRKEGNLLFTVIQ